jgi:predicted TIM-barrel fold metal-dependent hydrolase
VIVQGAHMGGDPENLDHLRQLLDAHPNLCLDTSATKWVTRELSLRVDQARRFFIDYADRLLFGTDLVPFKEPHPLHYASRYWTLQKLFETDYRGDSPIYDADACGPAHLNGLDLPDEVLRKIYHLNAERLLRIGGAGGQDPAPASG